MEIMSAAHIPNSHFSSEKLENLVALNGEVEGLEFRLPTAEECPDNVSLAWVSFFENQIESGTTPFPIFLRHNLDI